MGTAQLAAQRVRAVCISRLVQTCLPMQAACLATQTNINSVKQNRHKTEAMLSCPEILELEPLTGAISSLRTTFLKTSHGFLCAKSRRYPWGLVSHLLILEGPSARHIKV